MTTPTSPDAAKVEKVWFWANVYKASLALFALLEVGVLEKLAEKKCSASTLARELELSQEVIEPTLKLMSTLGVLEQDESGFSIVPATVTLLPLLSLESFLSHKHIKLDSLIQLMQSGKGRDPMAEDNIQEVLPKYLSAMAVATRYLAPYLVHFGNLRNRIRLLDLGGADGSLVLAMSRLIQDFEAIVIDRPQVKNAFQERTSSTGHAERFRFVADDLKSPQKLTYELSKVNTILLSNILHLLSVEERLKLLSLIEKQGQSGARILVYDQFLSPEAKIDSTLFMMVDWLLCGYRFDITEQSFAEELSELGFVSISYKRTSALPGAIVFAKIS